MSRNFLGQRSTFAPTMKNKYLSLLIIFSCLCIHSYSSPLERTETRKNWQLSSFIGTSINLTGNTSNPYSGLLSTRPSTVPSLNFRLTRYFTPRLGVCTNLHANFYEEKKSEYLNNSIWGDFAEELFDELFWPVSITKPAIDAGIIYRIEKEKWDISSSLGIGYMGCLNDREVSQTTQDYVGNKYTRTYKQEASLPYLNIDLSFNYFISKRCFIGLNADFQQPLAKAHAEMTEYVNSLIKTKISYDSATAGRNLILGVGFGFTF